MKKAICLIAFLAASGAAYAEKPACKVNVNGAPATEIEACLIGFGEKKAAAAVDARNKEAFKDLRDFAARVYGVGDKTLDKNADRICFDDACTGNAQSAPAGDEKTAQSKADDKTPKTP